MVSDVIVTVVETGDRDRRADVEICWQGGARTELTVKLNARGPDKTRLDDDSIDLIRRLARDHGDDQIAGILSRQGRATGTGLPWTATRVRAARQRAGIPAAYVSQAVGLWPIERITPTRHDFARRQRPLCAKAAGGV